VKPTESNQRTREWFPLLPVLIDTVDRRRRAAAELLAAAEHTRPGDLIPDPAGALRRAVAPKAAGHLTWAAAQEGRPSPGTATGAG
jgi:hypothetical protein